MLSYSFSEAACLVLSAVPCYWKSNLSLCLVSHGRYFPFHLVHFCCFLFHLLIFVDLRKYDRLSYMYCNFLSYLLKQKTTYNNPHNSTTTHDVPKKAHKELQQPKTIKNIYKDLSKNICNSPGNNWQQLATISSDPK